MRFLNRREFLIESALGVAGVAVAGTFANPLLAAAEKLAKKGDANDALHVAVVGVHGRGMSHVAGYLQKNTNTIITHICDADSAVIGGAMTNVEKRKARRPSTSRTSASCSTISRSTSSASPRRTTGTP